MFKKIVTYILILAMSTSGWAGKGGKQLGATEKTGMQGETCEAEGVKEMISEVSNIADYVEKARSYIDRSQFELETLLEKLDYDADKIIKFVKDEIYFEQYTGLLRGAKGTLMSRAGNALDQSVLLAGLLNDSGFDARIVRGELDEASAAKLLEQMGIARVKQVPIGDIAKMQEVMSSAYQDISGMSKQEADKQVSEMFKTVDVTKSPIYVQALTQTNMLLKKLQAENFFKDTERTDKALKEEAREYFWVQWREGPAVPWVDVDVAINSTTSIKRPEASRTFAKQVPSEYQHRLRVEVSLERDFNGQRNQALLALTSNQPTANLLGAPITVDLTPNGFQKKEDYGNLVEGLKRSELWIPFINKVPGKLAFDLQGNVLDPQTASASSAALFQTIGKKFTTAIGEIGEYEKNDRVAQIKHLWIDQITIAPNGKETRYRTDLLAKSMISIDNAERSPAQVDLEMKGLLSSSHSFMLAVGRYPESYILDRSLEKLIQTARFVEKQTDFESIDWTKIDSTNISQFQFFSMADYGVDFQDELSYRSGPSIVGASLSILPSGKLRFLNNIITSPKRTLSFKSGSPKLAPQKNVFSGVWESFVEGDLLKQDQVEHFSAAVVLSQAASAGESFKVLTHGSKKSLNEFKITDSAENWIKEDLAKSYAIVIPTNQFEQKTNRAVWWRVNPESGETLAMMQGGYGVELTDRAIITTVVVSYTLAIVVGGGCFADLGKDGKMSLTGGVGCVVCGFFTQMAVLIGVLVPEVGAAVVVAAPKIGGPMLVGFTTLFLAKCGGFVRAIN